MNKLPQKIKIGNLIFPIKHLEESERTHYGKSSVADQRIWMSTKFASDDKRNETFLHEITHVILDIGGYEKESEDEKFVNHISQTFYQVLKDNKLLK